MAFNTAIAHLPDGNHLSYMDSGPVKGTSAYTSVIMLHGTGFNGHVFEPLHDLAAQYRLRIFAVNRKGYTGSSNYSDAELDDIRNGKPAVFDRSAILVGHFIEHLVRKYDLPEPDAGRTKGGVVLLGWSMGCATVISFLGNRKFIPSEQYDFLRRYMTKLVFYDPPYSAFGFDGLSGKGTPYIMFGNTLEEHYTKFKGWASANFDHPLDWDGNPAKLASQPSTTTPSTTDSWTTELSKKIFQPQSAILHEWPQVAEPMQNALRQVTERALFDEACVKSTFPEVPVAHIVCWKSAPLPLWAYQTMKTLYEKRRTNGEFTRPLSFIIAKDVNHFWHWESPREFLQCLAAAVQGNSSIVP
ncbi:hypothetical protein D9756_008244 [Leucocoprinus leucothites]|uniref:AB hydrolase-1 domain-containing protein n=1 Tax=Leucocoprinus leucothites TaxID=201217 RepID=A0A8H5FWA6_9AGAR|nr:hypothetical protein D9756_008244 [Leucoagaricus leucothites]